MRKLASVLLFFALSACGTHAGAWCLSSPDCAAPMVCMLDTNDNLQTCQLPCGDGYAGCPPTMTCECPDSPLGKRCRPIGDTKRGPTPTDGTTWTGWCFSQ